MDYIPIEDCISKSGGSIYKLAAMVAKRAQELADGAKPCIESQANDKPLRIALREIQAGHVQIEKSKRSKKKD